MLCIELPLQHPFPSRVASRARLNSQLIQEPRFQRVTCGPRRPGLYAARFREADPSPKEAAVPVLLSSKKEQQQ